MSLALRNAQALRDAQHAYDNAEPPCDDGRGDYIEQQAGYLLKGWDADQVSFLPHKGMYGFANRADELLADQDCECQIVQIVVALLASDTDKAIELAERFRDGLAELAEAMVTTQLENRA